MEWPVVIVPWLSEGMFPSSKAAEENREDEERRLFYVVVTRAKDSLYMFAPSVRKSGDGGQFPVEASRFLREIPRDLINVKRIMDSPVPKPRYGGYSSGYGSRGGYGSLYGSGTSGWTSRNQTWRR
jgi:DNA helicase-2/ATP-dependent DNA helicase PcrA